MMEADAVISECGTYRYWLERIWDWDKAILPWVMLNPSTADHREDDPTIRRVIDYGRRWGYGGIVVVNLFGLRATNPRELAIHPDPVGPENDDYLRMAAGFVRGGTLMVAWGANHAIHPRVEPTLAALRDVEVPPVLHSLGVTKFGNPKHPLYVLATVEPATWEERP